MGKVSTRNALRLLEELGKDTFGYWKVLDVSKHPRKWECLCLGCNVTIASIDKYGLINGDSKSCRCQQSEALKKTSQERYGVDTTTILPNVKEKRKQTVVKKYGTEFTSQVPEVKEKIAQTNLKKYGVESFSKLAIHRNKLKEWCEENPGFNGTSRGELEILEFIKQYYPSACKFKKEGHELDIFIPEINLGIEFNGLYWHSEANKLNNYHLEKTKYFETQKIRTIHIFEHEWMKKEAQVKSFLLSAIGKNEHKIGARKCKVVWSDSKQEILKAHNLLDSTHVQGCTKSTKYVANVYYQEELLATATFGKHHRNSTEWVLSRFTTRNNYTIQGILSKISIIASKNLNSDIVSWADYRLSQGNGYEKVGWIKEDLLSPDYFYFKGTNIISKQSRQKKLVSTPEGMTEREHAKLDGLLRIYDCGKIRYRFNK